MYSGTLRDVVNQIGRNCPEARFWYAPNRHPSDNSRPDMLTADEYASKLSETQASLEATVNPNGTIEVGTKAQLASGFIVFEVWVEWPEQAR